jgi:hypothetical protein
MGIVLLLSALSVGGYFAYKHHRSQQTETKQLKRFLQDQAFLQNEAFDARKAMLNEAFRIMGQPQEVDWHDT